MDDMRSVNLVFCFQIKTDLFKIQPAFSNFDLNHYLNLTICHYASLSTFNITFLVTSR